MSKELILLDTDIGSDIDDAVCLAYLLMQPRCELLGITTVSGEPVKRAMLASAICRAAGRSDVPILPGSEQPLLAGVNSQPLAQQASRLDRWPHETRFPSGGAIEFLRQTIRSHPGEVTLLSIGPLTNVALLFKADQEIPRLLKQLVMMCGAFDHRVAVLEWNALLDPMATAIVYGTDVAVHRSIGLDVTTRVKMNAEEVKSRFTHPVLAPVVDFAGVWFEHSEVMTFHDPLAAVSVFDPDVCGYEAGDIAVELTSPRTPGMLFFERRAGGGREVATTVRPERFFGSYFSVFR